MPLLVATTGPAVLDLPAYTASLEGQQISINDSTVPDPLSNDVVFEITTDAVLVNTAAIPVTVSNTATATQVAAALGTAMQNAVLQGLLRRINPVVNGSTINLSGDTLYSVDLALAPGVRRLLVGDIRLTVPATGLVDGQTVTIQDGNGRSLTFELNDLGAANQTVTLRYVRVDVNLTTATPDTASAIAQKVADAINVKLRFETLTWHPRS